MFNIDEYKSWLLEQGNWDEDKEKYIKALTDFSNLKRDLSVELGIHSNTLRARMQKTFPQFREGKPVSQPWIAYLLSVYGYRKCKVCYVIFKPTSTSSKCASCNSSDVLRWKKENPHKNNQLNMRRKTEKLNGTNRCSAAEYIKIIDLYKEAERLTEETGIKWSVDHIIPISKGGLHCLDNLQLMTLKDNIKKGNRL